MKIFSTRFFTSEDNKTKNKQNQTCPVSSSAVKPQNDTFVVSKPDYHSILKNAEGNLSEHNIDSLINACKDEQGNVVKKIFDNALRLPKYNHPTQDIPPARIIMNCNSGFKGEDNFSQVAFDSALKLLDNGFSYGDTANIVDVAQNRDCHFNPRVIELAIEHKDSPSNLKILQESGNSNQDFDEYFFNKFVGYSENHVYSEQELSDFRIACLDKSLKFNKTAVDTGIKLASDYYDKCVCLREANQLISKCKDKNGVFKKEALESLTKDIPERPGNYYLYLSSRLASSFNGKGEFEKDTFDFYNYLAENYPEEDTDIFSGIIKLARNNEGVIDNSSKKYLMSALEKYGIPYATDLLPHLKNKKGNLNPHAVKAREKMEKDFEVAKIGWLDCLKCKNETYPDDIYEAFKYFKKNCKNAFVKLTENCKNKKGEFAVKIFEFEKKLLKKESVNNVANIIPALKTPDGNDIDKNKYKAFIKMRNNGLFVSDIKEILSLTDNVNNLNYNVEKAIEIDKTILDINSFSKVMGACADENGRFDEEKYNSLNRVTKQALKNKDVLRAAEEELSDDDVINLFYLNCADTVKAISLVGEKAMMYAFSFKSEELTNYIEKMASLSEKLSPEMKEVFLKNLNPINLKEYKILKEEQKVLKNNLQKQLSSEDKILLAESKNAIVTLLKENSELKSKINEHQLSETKKQELLKKIKDNNLEIKKHKLSVQKISDKHPGLQKRINEIDVKLRNLKENAVKDPKSLVEISNVFSAFEDEEKYLKPLLPYLNPKTPKEKELYAEQLNKLLFKKIGIKYDITTAQKLNLTNSPYLGELFNESYAFNKNITSLINVIKENRELTIAQALDSLPQNIETKRQFEAIGIDYDKWVNVDKNSYVHIDIQTDKESSQKAAIRNLEADFNDVDFKKLPKNEQNRLLDVLKQNEVELVSQEEILYDEEGYVEDRTNISRMYKDGKPLQFDMLEKLVTALKQDINSNPFWDSFDGEWDEDISTAKSTIYNHLVKLRYSDVKNALKVKDKKTVEMEVHKADMNNISHALFLGNQASCCTAVGTGSNQFSAPNYIKNKLISAIEVMDGSNFVGNTMCYFAKINGEAALVLDNIELSSQYQYNDKIRDAIFEYAKKLTAEAGKPDMPIYAGPNRHKVDMSNLKLKKEKMTIIGSTASDRIYLDFDANAHQIDGKKSCNVSLYKIK